jgi:threonine dehydratase
MFLNQDIEKLYDNFKGILIKTPCVLSPVLSEITQGKVYLKLENMQKTGSFKERGALSFLLHHKDRSLNHVVTASAGNHAQAVALHAARLKIPATIFMPIGTSNIKVVETERLKATVQLIGENYDEAYAAACNFAQKSGFQYVHAYNDLQVIAGQATVALEILSQVDCPDAIFVPIGGGGLIAGIAHFIANLKSATSPKIIGVEARDFQSMAQALNKGTLNARHNLKSIADGIAIRKVGELTEKICYYANPELTSVSDDQIQSAIILLLERQKVVTEGAGAATVAALLADGYRHSFSNKTVVLVISGGNIDISLLARLTAQELIKSRRLCRMSIVIKDSPGSLSALLQTVTKSFGNIVDIRHERSFANIRWNEVLVDVTVETKNEVHEDLMLSALGHEGYIINSHGREFNCG